MCNRCDFCKEDAVYDGKTLLGPWAFMCANHFGIFGIRVQGLYTELKKEVIEEKECCRCKTTKPISEFYKYADAYNHVRYRNECKKCNLQTRKIRSFSR